MPPPTAWRSGPSRPVASPGTRPSPTSSTGRTRRSRSGSSAASSTSPTTASTATSRTDTATRSRSTSSASPATPATITYAQLKDEVCKAANAIEELGIEAGDRVAIYLPMIPEAVIAMLACARLGAPHTVVFGGFSSDALASRVEDCEAKLIITADGGYRRGNPSALKPAVDEAIAKLGDKSPVENVLVVRRTGQEVACDQDIDVWWDELVDESSHRPHPAGVRRRAPALRHVHVRDHGQAQGHPAHHRRLPDAVRVHVRRRLRPQARHRRALVHRRRRLGHRPLLHRLRPLGRGRDAGALRRHARHARTRAAGGRSSRRRA